MLGRATPGVVQATLGVVLLAAGLAAVAAGILPAPPAVALGARVAPVLAFVVAVSVVAALAAGSGLFDRLAGGAAALARGSGLLLWLLVAALAVVSTVFLSLDTTAVLLTPVVVAVARRAGLAPLPFALLTVHLANTASLLLPVSNLTNLLAASTPAGGTLSPARTWAPALIAAVVPVVLLAAVHRRDVVRPFVLRAAPEPADRVLLRTAAVAVGLLLPALALGEPLLHVPVWVPAAAAAAALVVVTAVRRPAALSPRLLPVPLILLVSGLFLAIAALGRLGLSAVLAGAAGGGEGLPALLRLAGVGLAAANLTDNLPAYLALEPVAGSPSRLLALLVAVDAGPLITPWASLATLLWHARLHAERVAVPWRRFVLLGLLVAPITVAMSTAAILLVP